MKIFIADDHPRVRSNIKALLEQEYKGATFGEAGNGEDAYQQIKKGKWDLVIADVSMPFKSGVDLVKDIRKEKIETPFVLISLENDEIYKQKAIKAGASVLIDKGSAFEDLIKEVKKALMK